MRLIYCNDLLEIKRGDYSLHATTTCSFGVLQFKAGSEGYIVQNAKDITEYKYFPVSKLATNVCVRFLLTRHSS